MNNINDSIMSQLSLAESYLIPCEKSENLFKALNLLMEIFETIEKEEITKKDGGQTVSRVLVKIFECFKKTTNKAKVCLVYLVKKNKKLFENNVFVKDSKSSLLESLKPIINCDDLMTRRTAMELLKEFPFVVNLEILHTIFDFYTKEEFILENEKKIIDDLFDTMIKSNHNLAKNVQNLQKMILVK